MGLHIQLDDEYAYRIIEDGVDIRVEPVYGRVLVNERIVTRKAVYRCIGTLSDGSPRWARESPEYQWHRIAKGFVRWVESDLLPRRSREARLRTRAEELTDLIITHKAFLGDEAVQVAATELRRELFSGEEEDDHPLAN